MKWELLLEVEDVVTCFFVKSEKVHDAVLVDPYQTNAVSVVFSGISTGGTRCWCGQRLHFHVGGGGGSASVHQRIQISFYCVSIMDDFNLSLRSYSFDFSWEYFRRRPWSHKIWENCFTRRNMFALLLQ